MKPTTIVTVPPYADFIEEVVDHPAVSGIRLNTVWPIDGPLEDTLSDLQNKARDKDLWIDLKGRQLRVTQAATPPFTTINLSHNIKVNTPATAYFRDGEAKGTILRVTDGNKLIMQDGPKTIIGKGESVNIPRSGLEIEGYLTDLDQEYIAAATNLGLNNYMLSFVESQQDVDNFYQLVPDANLVAKIESIKGISYVRERQDDTRLMTARGDLYVELHWPHHLTRACEEIIRTDHNAIVASRIFPSLEHSPYPNPCEIGDVDNLLRMGYKTFMLGDKVCTKRDSVMSAINLFDKMRREY